MTPAPPADKYSNLKIWDKPDYVLSVWVMYCRYCVHKYHSYLTFPDWTLSHKLSWKFQHETWTDGTLLQNNK